MSDDLDITSGGAIAVDSSMVRDIGTRLGAVAGRLDDAADLVRRAGSMCALDPVLAAAVGTAGVGECAHRLAVLAEQTRSDVTGVQMMADTFELVELRNEQAALAVHRPDDAIALQGRIDALVDGDPAIENRAKMLIASWKDGRFDGTADQLWNALRDVGGTGISVGTCLLLLAKTSAFIGRGLLPFGVTSQGAPPPVRVVPVATGTATPVSGLKDSLARIPYDRTGQVVVEKYTMSGGAQRFIAYIDGTRTLVPGTEEPWDMGSNWDMYVAREQAASQVAVEQALAAAGAEPGDRVDLVGYSQGAAIASITAMEGTYDVDVVITAGDPVEPSLDADQTLVELRHRDDPISNLAGAGSAGGTGSVDGFTVRADAGPGSPIAGHMYDEYLDTAGQADASADPRVRGLHDGFFAELAAAERVETTEFVAKRP